MTDIILHRRTGELTSDTMCFTVVQHRLRDLGLSATGANRLTNGRAPLAPSDRMCLSELISKFAGGKSLS